MKKIRGKWLDRFNTNFSKQKKNKKFKLKYFIKLMYRVRIMRSGRKQYYIICG